MATKYKKNSTNTLFPRSDIAAFARYSSPKNSNIKGKEDNPGAKEGTNNLAVLYSEVPLPIPIKGKIRGMAKNNNRLSPRANKGNINRCNSTFMPNNAINMVAGNARLRITFFIPVISSLDLNFTLSKNPMKMKKRNTMVF